MEEHVCIYIIYALNNGIKEAMHLKNRRCIWEIVITLESQK